MYMGSGDHVAVDKNLRVSISELGRAAVILKAKVLRERDHVPRKKKIPGKMMTQMMKRKRMPAVQTVSRKRKKLDPDDFLPEDLKPNRLQ